MKNKDISSSCCNNRRRQSNKRFCRFCKRFGHSFETCYLRNKLAVSISAATVANTESGQPMALVFAQSQSSGSTFTISRDDLDLSYNLFSVGQLVELGYRIIFDYSGCIVQDPRTEQELGTGPRVGHMFPVDNLHLPLVAPISVAAVAAISFVPSLALWHARLGQTSFSRVQQLASRGLLDLVSTEYFDCVSCQLGKQPSLPFNTSESISIDIFNLIHSDVWGPSSVFSIGGFRYFVVFVDDYSCYS